MNRNCYRLVFNTTLGMMVPVAETAHSSGKSSAGKARSGAATSGAALALAGALLAGAVHAELPVASANFAAPGTTANYQASGAQAYMNQVGNKAIVNFQSFNISAGHDVQFRQVDSLATQNLVQGANFSSLVRIHDINPSIIAGSISQAAGQKASVTLINSNGIAFMGSAQVNVNNFTASTLNMQDGFLDNFLPGTGAAQFENALDGSEGHGFIKVFEGAQITAGTQGRVMLIAPTVINKGTVKAADGQVIAAAGAKVYLRSAAGDADNHDNVRGLLVEVDSPAGLAGFETANPDVKDGVLDGQAVSLRNAAEDKLGHVTNLGELSTPRGNVTMVGYAVNQQGIARATTSVVANGSVYLLAKDTKTLIDGNQANVSSSRAGRVLLGSNSLTEILPDAADPTTGLDGTTGAGLAKSSQVKVLGQDIYMAGGAVIHAPSAEVDIRAVDNPSDLTVLNNPNKAASDTARIHIASGARIDVAGLENVRVSVARNSVEVELRGDELKDSPVNQQGPLRGEKAYVDVSRALANANAGKSTLIAKDSLESYQAKLERGVAERSTASGNVHIASEGETILESGAVFDLSGGSVQYTAANTKTTLLTSGGKSVDIADATAETRYDGIATRYVKDYGRWNVKKVFDLGQSYRLDPGYVEGKNAGALDVVGMKTVVMQADIQGRTTVGELQRDAGLPPAGARLMIGGVTGDSSAGFDYKLNQRVAVSSNGATLPAGFKAGDALSQALKDTLTINPGLMGQDKVARLEIFSNQAADVRDALRGPQGGTVRIIASDLTVGADIEVGSGTIDLAARSNVYMTPENHPAPALTVQDGVTLSTRGAWVNDLPGSGAGSNPLPLLDGGTITLAADVSASNSVYDTQGTIELGQNTHIDVGSGARVRADGKLVAGKGGDISLSAYAVNGVSDNLEGYATGKGGKLSLGSHNINIGGAPVATPGTLNLDGGFFERGGFADFTLSALDTLTVADDTEIRPTVASLDMQPGYTLRASGSRLSDFTQIVKRDDRDRQAASLTLVANLNLDKGEPTEALIEQNKSGLDIGDILIGRGARIEVDPKAGIRLLAKKQIDIEGQLVARGGSIEARQDKGGNNALIWLGEQAALDTSGIARTYTDSKGLVQGEVLAGGTVNLNSKNGRVVTESGSRIDVSGATPVRLDVRNEAGGLGRTVGSDAGAVTVFAEEGLVLDGALAARAGSPSNRGGRLSLTLSSPFLATAPAEYANASREFSLAQNVALQAAGVSPGAPVFNTGVTRAHIGVAALEAAGFDRMSFSSGDAIRLEDGLSVGADRSLPLRELTFDAARIETAGGDVALRADTLRLGNFKAASGSNPEAPVDSGVLHAEARLLELAGDLRMRGMERIELTGTEQIRVSGVTDKITRPLARIQSTADMVLHGAVVAPAVYTQASILAPGKTITFTRTTDTPLQPLAALGSLTVEAKDIVQGGNVWAPLGQLDFRASESLTFKDGSLTSVAAAPGSLLPFGKVENGRAWGYDVNPGDALTGNIKQANLDGKAIRTAAASIDMQPGAKVNLAGGGDLQAYEFTVGPGGSRDILADKNTYAILPGFKGGFAPGDAQEGFDRASGEAVYLSGVAGLADGVYTLLPAHYALLPGAYAVKLDSGIRNVLPGQAYSRQDGVRVAAGYVTDSRTDAPKDANWQGIQVLTQAQVRARSEFTLTHASQFFADSRNRPQDAGLLSIATTGSGADALKLDAVYNLAAGQGGRGAQVDISALKLAVTSGTSAGIDPEAVVLDAGKLNALGAESLFIGGTRSTSGDTTTLSVGAESLTLANGADHALKAGEILLAAKDTLTLKAGSAIDAQGASGDAGAYEIDGNGAFVRAASTTATFARTGSPDRSQGTLIGEAGSTITAVDSITLDATQLNAYKGTAKFERDDIVNGVVVRSAVAGNLGVGATRVNFGAAGAATDGITYSQTELDALDLKGLTLTSYSTFDLYGDVKVGQLDANGKPLVQNLTLQGAGLAGIDNAGLTAQLNAKNLTLTNPNNAASFADGGTLGSGSLAVTADTLTLGSGDKAIKGFDAVTVTANELVGSGTGKFEVAAPLTLNVARISSERGANQILNASGALTVAQHTADRTLASVTALGAKWALAGTRVDFDSHVELPSGSVKLSATGGLANDNVTLGANAKVDVAGRSVQFFDVTKPSWGGTAEFVSDSGNVDFATGSKVDVSAAAGGDAGTLIVRAVNGTFTAASDSVVGTASANANGERGEGARAQIDTGTLASFSTLNTALNSGGFDGARTLRVRSGDVNIAEGDSVKALDIKITADNGKLNVAGTLDASGTDAGRIELFAKGNVNVQDTAKLKAASSGAFVDGGDIEIGTTAGKLDLASGSTIALAGGAGGEGGTLLLRASRFDNPSLPGDGDDDVNITAVKSTINGERSVAVEAVKVYDNINTLTATGASSGSTLSLATIKNDNTAFAGHFDTDGNYVDHYAAIKDRLGKTDDPLFHILSGVEVRSSGDLTLGTGTATTDWNLSTVRANGEAGVLTLRAAGNLKINSNLSDGFSHATAYKTGTTPADLLAGDSWSYRLIAGADSAAADPLAVKPVDKDFTLALGKLIRTGTGDIRITSGRDIKLADNKAVIYTAGRSAGALSGFTQPATSAAAFFSQGGGDVSLAAMGNIVGAPSAQLFNNWLFRQGSLNADGSAYTVQPAWWVRFDQFQQGVGALGGGDVTITAGGEVKNLSAHTPTQARMASSTPDAAALSTTGGGTVRIEAAKDILGGQYYADRGDVVLRAGGKVDSGQSLGGKPIYAILALGDAQARVRANDSVTLQALVTPQLLPQSESGAVNNTFNLASNTMSRKTAFSTFTDASGTRVESLGGTVTLARDVGNSLRQAYSLLLKAGGNAPGAENMNYLPPNLTLAAFQGDVEMQGSRVMQAAPRGGLGLLAQDTLRFTGPDAKLVLSDRDPAQVPTAVMPNIAAAIGLDEALLHAPTALHAGDPAPLRLYAVTGDIQGVEQAGGGGARIVSAKAFSARAGRDISNLTVEAQHPDADNVSLIEAGRDIVFASGANRTEGDHIQLGGRGSLDVIAGRNIDLGTSGGILSRGNLVNAALPGRGADIHIAAGVGANGVDYTGAVDRLLARLAAGAPDDATLWQARWLTGDNTLTAANALQAVQGVKAQGADVQQKNVQAMLFTALRETGSDHNNKDSAYAGDYTRGYAAIELVFPGISEKSPDGRFKNYQGDINLFASRVKTESGGHIEWLAPGGDMIVGLANTPKILVDPETLNTSGGGGVLGIVAASEGDIKGFTRGGVLVNQSRILTVGGGDVLLWSSEGDIDAGKGKKTAVAVPPPLILVDSKGNVTQVLQGAASGSGIGALKPAGGTAGDVDLIAPKGTVNAGDAGIRAGNLNIAASLVIGADNISVSGSSSGTPVADTSAVTAASSGASSADGGTAAATAALSSNLADAARAAEELKQAFKPTFITAEVVGHGE